MQRLFAKENSCESSKPIEKPLQDPTKKRIFGTDLTVPRLTVCKIDENDINDPKLLGEYAGEIYKIMHSSEEKYITNDNYMKFQTSINESMRATLVDWLIDVHLALNLLEETLFLTVSLLDRYLSKTIVKQNYLQLIGVTCLFIACKFEETYSPELSTFVYITDKAYTAKDIINTERLVLRCLNFEINVPSCLQFFERYSKICKFDRKSYFIGLFLIEIALIDFRFLDYKPSTVSTAAVYLSKKILKKTLKEIKAESLNEENIDKCLIDFIETLEGLACPCFQSTTQKFLHENFLMVSQLF